MALNIGTGRPTKRPENWRVLERLSQNLNSTVTGLAAIPGERLLLPGADLRSIAGPTIQAWPTANKALGIPFDVYGDRTLAAIHYAVAAVGATPSFDVGIYRTDGTRVISQGGLSRSANTPYRVALSVALPAGRYYAFGASGGATINVYQDTRAVGNEWPPFEMMGCQSALNSYPLPATLTFESPVTAGVFCCSIEFV